MKLQFAAKLVFLFLLSFAALFVLSMFPAVTGFGNWSLVPDLSRIDYFFVLAPVAGFFMVFFLLDWIEKYFETKFTKTAWFGVFFSGLAVTAYYVALFWFYCNMFSLAQTSACSPEGASQTSGFLSSQTPINNVLVNFLSDFPLDFIGKFFGSLLRTQFIGSFLSGPYIIFVLAGLAGWACRILLEKTSQ